MSNVTVLAARRPVVGLSPQPIHAHLIARPTHLQCGRCGFNGVVEFYVPCDGTDPFEPVCGCPIDAMLLA